MNPHMSVFAIGFGVIVMALVSLAFGDRLSPARKFRIDQHHPATCDEGRGVPTSTPQHEEVSGGLLSWSWSL